MVKYIFDYSKLLGRMRETNMTQLKLANKLGISAASLNNKLKSKTSFTSSEMYRIAMNLKIPDNDISDYFFKQFVPINEQIS